MEMNNNPSLFLLLQVPYSANLKIYCVKKILSISHFLQIFSQVQLA